MCYAACHGALDVYVVYLWAKSYPFLCSTYLLWCRSPGPEDNNCGDSQLYHVHVYPWHHPEHEAKNYKRYKQHHLGSSWFHLPNDSPNESREAELEGSWMASSDWDPPTQHPAIILTIPLIMFNFKCEYKIRVCLKTTKPSKTLPLFQCRPF